MRAVAVAVAVSLGLGLGLGLGCGSGTPASRAPAGDPAAPALLAHVPADTPYVLASFDAIPVAYWDKVASALKPVFFRALRYLSAADDSGVFLALADAIGAEFQGGLTVANLERLGLSATPRYAFYAVDLTTVVLRVEIDDDATLLATIDRVARRAKLPLPPRQQRDGRQFWRLSTTATAAAVVAAVDDQLVIAFGKAADVDRNLPAILGLEKPRASMAGGAALAQLRARHGYGGQLLGFVDSRRFAQAIVRYHGAPVATACTREIEHLAARVPRFVFGWEVAARESRGGFVLELPPDLVAELQQLVTEVPAIDLAVADGPQISFGGGFDLVRGWALARTAVQALQRITAACDGKPDPDLAEAEALLAKPLEAPIAGLRGFLIAIHDIAFPPGGGMPSWLDVTLAVTGVDAGELLDLGAVAGLPAIARDGALHEVSGIPLPYKVLAGAGAHALVVAVGPNGTALARQVLAATPRKRAPLFAVNYDVAAWERLQRESEREDDDAPLPTDVERGIDDAYAKLYGRTRGTLTIEKAGLTGSWTTELR